MGSPNAQLALGIDGARAPLAVLDTRARGAAFLGLEARTALNPPSTTGMDFWTFNPYVGCEFGCCYCYARGTHRWTTERVGGPGADQTAPGALFERNIFVKHNAARVVARTLDPAKLAGQPLLIGTATDPYQPAERRFGVTRSVLQTLLGFRGLEIWITTKSPLIARDARLLAELSERHTVSVSLSMISLDTDLVRRLEPRSPVPGARLRALRTLAAAGLSAGILVAPIIPGLTDGWAALGALLAAAREAGARFAVGSALRLAPVARAGFFPVLEREFPHLVDRYRRHYGGRHGAGRDYLAALGRRMEALQVIHGFPVRRPRYGGEPVDSLT